MPSAENLEGNSSCASEGGVSLDAHPDSAPFAGEKSAEDLRNERLIDTIRECFAELVKTNEQQMDKLQASVEGLRTKPSIVDKKTAFWNAYRTVAKDYDSEYERRYSTDLDTSLIFSGLFSAVISAFIIQIQPEIRPTGTRSVVLLAQCLLYVSLFLTLLIAWMSVLAKRWLKYYSADGAGSIEDRGLERMRKLNGLNEWKFDMILQSFPLLLQLALFLFGTALSVYLSTSHRSLAITFRALTISGFGLYFLILVSASACPEAPFQGPLPILLARLISWSVSTTPWMKSKGCLLLVKTRLCTLVHDFWPTCLQFSRHPPPDLCTPSPELCVLAPMFEIQYPELSPEIPAILWVWDITTDQDAVIAAAELSIEVQWPNTIDLRPRLDKLYDVFLACFETTRDHMGDRRLTCVRDGMSRRAICIGRAFGTLLCVHRSMQPKVPMTLSYRIANHPHDVKDMFEPELANVILLIFNNIPDLVVDLILPPAMTWAMRVIPAYTYGAGFYHTNPTDSHPYNPETPDGQAINGWQYFISQFRPDMKLSASNFADYLFCLNHFLSKIDTRVILWMDKRRFEDLFMIQLFEVMLDYLKWDHYIALVSRTVQTTAQLAAQLSDHFMEPTDRALAAVYQFCSAFLARSPDWTCVFSALSLVRKPAESIQRVEGGSRGVEWTYMALEYVQQSLDAPNHLEPFQLHILNAAQLDLFQAFYYYSRVDALSAASPPVAAFRAIVRGLSVPRGTNTRIDIPGLSFSILCSNQRWMDDRELWSTMEELSMLSGIGQTALRQQACATLSTQFEDLHMPAKKYLEICVLLAKHDVWRQHMKQDLITWVNLYFSVDLVPKRVVEMYNWILRRIWEPDTDLYEFDDDYEKALGLTFVALSQFWTPDFTRSSRLNQYVGALRWTGNVSLRGAYRGTKPGWTMIMAHFEAAFSVRLRNSLVQAAAAFRRRRAGESSNNFDGVSLEGLERIANMLEDLASKSSRKPPAYDSKSIDLYWSQQRKEFHKEMDDLEKSRDEFPSLDVNFTCSRIGFTVTGRIVSQNVRKCDGEIHKGLQKTV